MQAFKNFRTYFFRGMAALLPTVLTIWIFVQLYFFIQNNVSKHINGFIVNTILLVTKRWDEPLLINYWVEGKGQITGFVVTLIGVCILGALLASVVGRTLWHIFEKALARIPFVKKVYPYIKQITDFLLTKKKLSFNKVVAIQYPRKGLWSVALVTGSGLRAISGGLRRKEYLTVFVPSSPTPFTGYVIITAKEDTIELDMTIEEALRFTVSGGVISPAEHEAFEAMRSGDEDSESSGK